MKIIDVRENTIYDYRKARDIGRSCHIIHPNVPEIPPYEGVPALIFEGSFSDMYDAYAIPYEKMAARRQLAIETIGLDGPKIVFSTTSKVFSNIWLTIEDLGGTFIGPYADQILSPIELGKLLEGQQPNIIHGHGQIIAKMCARDVQFDTSKLERVVVSVGCGPLLTLDQISMINKKWGAPVVNYLQHPVCGIIASDGGINLQDGYLSVPFKDCIVSIDKHGHLLVGGYAIDGVSALDFNTWRTLSGDVPFDTEFLAHIEDSVLYLDGHAVAE